MSAAAVDVTTHTEARRLSLVHSTDTRAQRSVDADSLAMYSATAMALMAILSLIVVFASLAGATMIAAILGVVSFVVAAGVGLSVLHKAGI